VRNGRDRNSYRSLADTHGLALFGQSNFLGNMPQRFRDYGIPTKKLPMRERKREKERVGGREGRKERERANYAFLVAECAPLARGEFPAPFWSFQSVTLISDDFPYLSLSRLKLHSPPCDGGQLSMFESAQPPSGLAGWFALREFVQQHP